LDTTLRCFGIFESLHLGKNKTNKSINNRLVKSFVKRNHNQQDESINQDFDFISNFHYFNITSHPHQHPHQVHHRLHYLKN
jgi:hypothetical protein